jgi:hypothetical protein
MGIKPSLSTVRTPARNASNKRPCDLMVVDYLEFKTKERRSVYREGAVNHIGGSRLILAD